MLNKQQKFGKTGEAIALKEMRKRGYKILETNFRTKPGEIDIIAKDNGTIVFVEVKARKTSRFGDAKYSITLTKQRKISMEALTYLKKTENMQNKARFDVVIIHPDNRGTRIEIIKNAFELAYS